AGFVQHAALIKEDAPSCGDAELRWAEPMRFAQKALRVDQGPRLRAEVRQQSRQVGIEESHLLRLNGRLTFLAADAIAPAAVDALEGGRIQVHDGQRCHSRLDKRCGIDTKTGPAQYPRSSLRDSAPCNFN